MTEIPFTFVRGFAMGSADIVPGVSGGTVALVFAIYHRLIEAIRTGSMALGRFIRFDWAGGLKYLRAVEWTFLIPLGLGILTAVLTLAGPIEHQLETHPVQMAGLFLGLVGGSTVVATGLLRAPDVKRIGLIIGSGLVFFAALGLVKNTSADAVAQAAAAPLWFYFISGAIAICAMILPGISGSFLLVILGMYSPVLAAVSELNIPIVAVFGLGCVVGLALFSQLLHWALSVHYDNVMSILIGLMLGSLRVLWPWPNGVDSTELGAPDEAIGVTIGLAIFGVLLVVAINEVAKRLEHRKAVDEANELRAS